MANIRKIEGKNGTSYKITVTRGRDSNGKQIRHYLTWTPEPKMTKRQIEKELQKAAFEFEKNIDCGFAVDNRQTFSEYARYVIDLKEQAGAKHRTIHSYRKLLLRIDPAIGHIKLVDLKPQHLNVFYKNLSETGIRDVAEKAKVKVDLSVILKAHGFSKERLAVAAGISTTTLSAAIKGDKITKIKAQAISDAIGEDLHTLFNTEKDTRPLSNKTITEYHRLISTVLNQAEKEMLVQFNAASKATPPKLEKNEAETFQPEEVEQIRDCLEQEPIKWRTATHLLLITGARRGEIMGLKWDNVDWDSNQIKIDRASLYSSDRGIYEDTTKTYTVRFIKLPVETMELLQKYRCWYIEQQLMNGDRWNNTGYLFVQNNGKAMSPDSLTNWLRKFAVRYNLPNVHPHKFRHTMASLLYYNGLDSISISKRLGHAKVSTTTDIYSHIIKQAEERASECIADVVLRPKNRSIG